MIKISVNGKNFKKWNTANKQAKKDGLINIVISEKNEYTKKYTDLISTSFISIGDLQNEVKDYLDLEIEKIHKEGLNHLANKEINLANNCTREKRSIKAIIGSLERVA